MPSVEWKSEPTASSGQTLAHRPHEMHFVHIDPAPEDREATHLAEQRAKRADVPAPQARLKAAGEQYAAEEREREHGQSKRERLGEDDPSGERPRGDIDGAAQGRR